MSRDREIAELLTPLYGGDAAASIQQLFDRLAVAPATTRRRPVDAAVVAAYPDQAPAPNEADASEVGGSGRSALRTTTDLLRSTFGRDALLHVLPPYCTADDDRFAVVDDSCIDPRLGSWTDLDRAAPLMLDLVVNQLSADSAQFRGALTGRTADLAMFRRVPEGFDFSCTATPRDNRPVRRVVTAVGEIDLWSSHGGRQFDLDYSNPDVLAFAMNRLANLAPHAAWIRLDGVAYSWKASGTSCANLPEAQRIAGALARTWHAVAGGVCVAEVDDYADDRSFAWSGVDLVLNYRMPPTLAMAVLTGDVGPLERVLDECSRGPGRHLNPGMTHDGVSLRAWAPVLDASEIARLTDAAAAGGQRVVFAPSPGRPQDEYEFDATMADLAACRGPRVPVRRLVQAVNSVLLAARGVPYLYVLGALGQRGDPAGNGRQRVRGKLQPTDWALSTSDQRELLSWIHLRATLPCLRTEASQSVRRAASSAIVIDRTAGNERLAALHNFGAEPCVVGVAAGGTDLRTGEHVGDSLTLAAGEARWVHWGELPTSEANFAFERTEATTSFSARRSE